MGGYGTKALGGCNSLRCMALYLWLYLLLASFLRMRLSEGGGQSTEESTTGLGAISTQSWRCGLFGGIGWAKGIAAGIGAMGEKTVMGE